MRPKQLCDQQSTKIKDITEKDVQGKRDFITQFQPFSVYTYVVKPISIYIYIYIYIYVRTRFDLNPKREWIQAHVAQTMNL